MFSAKKLRFLTSARAAVMILVAASTVSSVRVDAVIDGDTVVVSSPSVLKLLAARHAFQSNTEDCNIYGKKGLPTRPFRADKW